MKDEVIDFRGFVKRCAKDRELVTHFNRSYGGHLRAPIEPLIDDSWTSSSSEDERLLIGCFIVFVHQQIWAPLQTLAHRTHNQVPRKRTAPSHT